MSSYASSTRQPVQMWESAHPAAVQAQAPEEVPPEPQVQEKEQPVQAKAQPVQLKGLFDHIANAVKGKRSKAEIQKDIDKTQGNLERRYPPGKNPYGPAWYKFQKQQLAKLEAELEEAED